MNFLIKTMILFFIGIAFVSLVLVYAGAGKTPLAQKTIPVAQKAGNIFHSIMSFKQELSIGLEKEWKNVHKIKIMKYNE